MPASFLTVTAGMAAGRHPRTGGLPAFVLCSSVSVEYLPHSVGDGRGLGERGPGVGVVFLKLHGFGFFDVDGEVELAGWFSAAGSVVEAAEEGAHSGDAEPGFFCDLADQGLGECFTGFDLAARQLPDAPP